MISVVKKLRQEDFRNYKVTKSLAFILATCSTEPLLLESKEATLCSPRPPQFLEERDLVELARYLSGPWATKGSQESSFSLSYLLWNSRQFIQQVETEKAFRERGYGSHRVLSFKFP